MAKLLGNNYRLWIESTTPGTYNMVKGQGSVSQSGSANTIDTSTKENFPYATNAPGMRNGSLSLELKPDLPDATGFTRLEALANAAVQDPFSVQIRKDGASGTDPADVVFECLVYCSDFPKNFGMNDAVSANITLVYAEAPTIDTLL